MDEWYLFVTGMLCHHRVRDVPDLRLGYAIDWLDTEQIYQSRTLDLSTSSTINPES